MSEQLQEKNHYLSPTIKDLLRYFSEHNQDNFLELVNWLIDVRVDDSEVNQPPDTKTTPNSETGYKNLETSLSTVKIWQRLRLPECQEIFKAIISTPNGFSQYRRLLTNLDANWNLGDVRKVLALTNLSFETRTAILLVAPSDPNHLLVTLETIGAERLRNNHAFEQYADPGTICKNLNIEWSELVLSPDKTLTKIREFLFRVNPFLEKYWWLQERNALLNEKSQDQLIEEPPLTPHLEYETHKAKKSEVYTLHAVVTGIPNGEYRIEIDASSWIADDRDEEEEKPLILKERYLAINNSLVLPIQLYRYGNKTPFPYGRIYLKLVGEGHDFNKIFSFDSPYNSNRVKPTLTSEKTTAEKKAMEVPTDEKNEKATQILPRVVVDEKVTDELTETVIPDEAIT